MIQSITTEELDELFKDTLGRCTMKLLDESDEEIGYQIFEEFDIGATSFLHDNSLKKLLEAGRIDDEIATLSRELRNLKISMQESGNWDIDLVRSAPIWKQLFELSDKIRQLKAAYDRKDTIS